MSTLRDAPKSLVWVDNLFSLLADVCFGHVYELGEGSDDTFAYNTNSNISILGIALRNTGVKNWRDIEDHGFSCAFERINSRLDPDLEHLGSQDHIFRTRIAALYVFKKVLAVNRWPSEVILAIHKIEALLLPPAPPRPLQRAAAYRGRLRPR